MADQDSESHAPLISEAARPQTEILLGIDTCGPSGSAALGRLEALEPNPEIVGQIELEGRSYSATLIAGVDNLLARAGLRLRDITCLVAVNGPGSFTGVRVGLSAVKGLAEAAEIPIVTISRLEVLAAKAGTTSSALDAHRSEVFLRLGQRGRQPAEMLAGAMELAGLDAAPDQVAVCDDGAVALLTAAWPSVELVRVDPPTASDALRFSASRVVSREFVDPLLLDGHYLRRSDAEIFGDPALAAALKR